jgi:hypothetical protein
MFFKGKKIPLREDLKKPLTWAVLVLALAACFSLGFLLGREDTPTPIIIETSAERALAE